MGRELERAAILRDRPHHAFWRACRQLCLDLESDHDLRSNKTGQVRDDLFGDATRIPADPGSRLDP